MTNLFDHKTLLGYLKSWFGFGGAILQWFVSYLSNPQAIKIGLTLFELSKLIYGVPQDSVLCGGLMQSFPSLNMFRRPVKHASSKCVTFME